MKTNAIPTCNVKRGGWTPPAGWAALGRRTWQRVRQAALPQIETCLGPYLPLPLLKPTQTGANSRRRIYSVRLTTECFLWQVLQPGTACRKVVRQVQALFRLRGWGSVKKGTSGYCMARQRLPAVRVETAVTETSRRADAVAQTGGTLHGRPVHVVDASGVQLPDTPANRKAYPPGPNQKKGCGFPMMKLLVWFSLCSGTLQRVRLGPLHQHELRLFRRTWRWLQRGAIILADRLFSDYVTLVLLPLLYGVDVVSRINVRRAVDFRKARRLGRKDGLFVWTKPQRRPPYLTPKQWAKVPATLTVRVLRFRVTQKGFRSPQITLVTTLLDPRLYPLADLAALYARRWRLELCLDDLKTTLGMAQLRSRTPAMARKEVLMHLLAHNLVRCVMAEAVARYQVALERVSFAGALDTLSVYTQAIVQAPHRATRQVLWQDLLENLARDLIPERPGRREPRAVKQRPKPYPRLTKPRHQFKDPIRYSRWKQQQKVKK